MTEVHKVGELLKCHRVAFGIGQSELAEALGVTVQAISNWECGRFLPNVKQIQSFVSYYQLDEVQLEILNKSYEKDIAERAVNKFRGRATK